MPGMVSQDFEHGPRGLTSRGGDRGCGRRQKGATYVGPGVSAVIALSAGLWKISGPSFTRDEGATMLAVNRPFPELMRMLGNVDVVHGAYYTLIWVVTRLAGRSELAVRFPSALALAVAAGAVAALGQRLVSAWAGLAAGLVFAGLPTVSWYAEDARDDALAAGLAAIASYLLIRAMDSGRTRRRWLLGYGVTLAMLGLTSLFSLLIIPAHALALAARLHRDPPGRRFAVSWLVTVSSALIAVSPVAVSGYFQLRQIHWLSRPGLAQVAGLARLIGPAPVGAALLICLAGALTLGASRGRTRLRADWPASLLALALPWLVLPPAILLAASLVHPVYTIRYVAFCIPAAALLAGAALATLGQVIGPAALLIVAVAGLPAQLAERAPGGHGFNIRRVDQMVARQARPRDAVLNFSSRPAKQANGQERGFEAAYPYGLAALRDISQGATPAQSATLGGTFASAATERQRLAGVRRLWVVAWRPKSVPVLRRLGFTLARQWHISHMWIRLMTRRDRRDQPRARSMVRPARERGRGWRSQTPTANVAHSSAPRAVVARPLGRLVHSWCGDVQDGCTYDPALRSRPSATVRSLRRRLSTRMPSWRAFCPRWSIITSTSSISWTARWTAAAAASIAFTRLRSACTAGSSPVQPQPVHL